MVCKRIKEGGRMKLIPTDGEPIYAIQIIFWYVVLATLIIVGWFI